MAAASSAINPAFIVVSTVFAFSTCAEGVSVACIPSTPSMSFRYVHVYMPLSSSDTLTQKWNGSHFEKSSLREVGHIFQLGHHPADQCTNPQHSTRPFTVVHTNGIHLVNVAYCGCTEAVHHGTRVQQLLRRRLFPATTLNPMTACTFSLLESAQLLSLQSKLSLYDYYLCVERLTDATGAVNVNVRSPPRIDLSITNLFKGPL